MHDRRACTEHLCFFETAVISGVSVLPDVSVLSDDSQSSAARLGGEVSLSFSRFCSFFGSWSRTQRGPAPRFPPRPRQFCCLEKTAHEECTVVMAAEGRHKFPSTLGMAGEERHKSLLFCILNVCSIGSALALLMTPSEEGPDGSSEVGRGSRGRVCAPESHSWSFNTVQGVLAVHSSDLDKAHHINVGAARAPPPLGRRRAAGGYHR